LATWCYQVAKDEITKVRQFSSWVFDNQPLEHLHCNTSSAPLLATSCYQVAKDEITKVTFHCKTCIIKKKLTPLLEAPQFDNHAQSII
jgi:hypothetical protein